MEAEQHMLQTSLTEKMINYLINQRGFALGYPVEASLIVQATDYVLTSCLGSTLKLIAIIDTDSHPTKRAVFSEQEMSAFRTSLSQFAYHAYGKRLDVSLEIWYIGKQASHIFLEMDVLSTQTTKYKFWVSSWAFDSHNNQIICNSLSLRNWLRKRQLLKELRKQNYAHNTMMVPASS